jgi:hypothetical protein
LQIQITDRPYLGLLCHSDQQIPKEHFTRGQMRQRTPTNS